VRATADAGTAVTANAPRRSTPAVTELLRDVDRKLMEERSVSVAKR